MNQHIDDEKIERIRLLYEENPVAQRFLDWAANRQRDATETAVDRAVEVVRADASDMRALFREFESIGLGILVQGRKGYKTRFEWDFSLISIGKVSKRQAVNLDTIDVDTAEPPEEPAASASSEAEDQVLLKHSFHLRPNLPISVALPADLTAREAERIAAWVRTLTYE